MSNIVLAKAHDAQSVIGKFHFVKPGSADGTTLLAGAATDPIVGISGELDVQVGERHDVTLIGISYLVAGAAFTRGAVLTSDANGCGVAAATGNRIGALALESASTAGDMVRVLVTPGVN